MKKWQSISLTAFVSLSLGYAVGLNCANKAPTNIESGSALNDPLKQNTNDQTRELISQKNDEIIQQRTRLKDHSDEQKLLVDENQKLRQLVKDLQTKLLEKDNSLQAILVRNQNLTADLEKAKALKPAKQTLKITKEQAEAALPEPFSQIMTDATGMQALYFEKFNQEKVDYDWGPTMESNISQFISLHEQSYEVKIDSVKCRQSICEIRGLAGSNNAWSSIMNGMMQQDWWHFSGASTNSANTSKEGMAFYALLSRAAG